jgi:hypothetical protein
MITIEQLVGAANDRLLFETINKILDHAADDLSDSDLERLAALLSPEEWGGRAFRFDAERANFQDLLQRTYSDDGNGDGVLLLRHLGAVSPVPVGESSFLSVLSQPIVNMYTVSRKEASALFEAHLAAVEVASGDPLHEIDWETLDRLQACMAPQSDSLRDKIRSFPMSLLAVDWTNLLASNQLAACELNALRVIVALHRQHRRSPDGRWPETLEALDPDLLDSIPIDPYGGAPLRYGLVDGQPRLWSIGADRVDDAGLLPEASCECDDRARRFQRPGTEVPDALRGDWILWRGPVRP